MKSNILVAVMLATVLCVGPRLACAQVPRGAPISGPPLGVAAAATNSPARNSSAALATATNASAPPQEVALSKDPEFVVAGFDKLSRFNFEGSDAPVSAADAATAARKTMAQIPDSVKALNEKRVAVRGFMLPMKVDAGMVTEFLLLRNQMGCCYGLSPGINEWVDVHTTGKGVKSMMDDLITVYGTLHVGEVRENGYLTGIYRMDFEKMQLVRP